MEMNKIIAFGSTLAEISARPETEPAHCMSAIRKRLYTIATSLLICACAYGQKAESHNSAVSRNLEIFNELYKQLDLFYVDTLNADTVMGWCIEGMLMRVDPYTNYFPEGNEDLRQMATGKYAGIGSAIRFHKKEDRVVISEPYEESPSQKAGVRAGDVILEINQRDVKGLPTEQVSKMLRGEAGTTFELKVRRKGKDGPQTLALKITRENIQIKQVPYYGMLRPKVGYIYLTGFTEGATGEMRHALTMLKQQGAESLVLDLRGNPGGAINEAVDIAGLFLPKGKKVVYTKGKVASTNREYYSVAEPMDTLMPMAVLVDGGSASSAEIVSGSLQDMDRAVIIGTRTYGKGLVQAIRDLPYRSNLKITTSRYYIPSGRCIQAYDYRHLNPDGSVGTVPDSLTHVFHTQGGREVRDGGGIKPDVEVIPDSLPTLVYDLVASDEFFDYVTDYVSRHAAVEPEGDPKIHITDEEYTIFVDYICQSGFTYNRRSDNLVEMMRKMMRREGYLDKVAADLDALQAKLKTDLRTDLEKFRQLLEPYICEEIASRYFLQKGAVRQQLTNDKCVDKALELLADKEQMKQLLSVTAE